MAGEKGLGLGLDSLFYDNNSDSTSSTTLRVSEIEPNRNQPRKNFDDEAIQNLADSILEHGVISPIVVRPYGLTYQIIAGERRWRAARMAGLAEVPVVIKDLTDLETLQIALIENLQRENLNPVEEAEGYRDLSEKFHMSHENIAKVVGRSRSAVTNAMRILELPEEILDMLANGDISTGHAKALLSFDDEEKMLECARKAAEGKLTVRQLEKIAKQSLEEEQTEASSNTRIDSYFKEMEISLNSILGRKVKVDYGKNKGALILEFYDKEDLQAIADKLSN